MIFARYEGLKKVASINGLRRRQLLELWGGRSWIFQERLHKSNAAIVAKRPKDLVSFFGVCYPQ